MQKTLGIVFLICLTWIAWPQEVRVTTPDSLDYWDIGKTYTIEWQTRDITAANVKIRLYDKTGTDILLKITNSTPNDGSFDWEVPGNLSEGKYVIRVKVMDQAYGGNSDVFHIRDRRKIKIRLLSPTGGESFAVPGSMVIKWEMDYGHLVEHVKLVLKKGGTVLADTVGPNSGGIDFMIPDNVTDGDDYAIRIEDADDAGIFAESGYFSVRHTRPGSITLTGDGSPYCLRGESQRLAWTCSGFDGLVRVNLYRDESFVKTILGSTRESAVTWRVDEPAGTGYRITLNAVNQPRLSARGDAFAIFNAADLLVFSRGILPKQTFLTGESTVLRAEVENPANQAVPADVSIRFVRGRVARTSGIAARKLYQLAGTKYSGSPTAALNAGGRTSLTFPVTIGDDPPGDYTVIITIMPSQTSDFRDNHPGNNTIYGYYKVGLKLLRTIR